MRLIAINRLTALNIISMIVKHTAVDRRLMLHYMQLFYFQIYIQKFLFIISHFN